MNKGSAESVLISKRQLVELYASALRLNKLMMDFGRLRLETTAIVNEIENLISRVAPGIIAEVRASISEEPQETTPVQIPRPCPVCKATIPVGHVKCQTCGHLLNQGSIVRKKEE